MLTQAKEKKKERKNINKSLKECHSFSRVFNCDVSSSISETEREKEIGKNKKRVPVCVTHLDTIFLNHHLRDSKAILDLACFPSSLDRTFSLAEYEK